MTTTENRPTSPISHLDADALEQLGKEFDAIHDEVYADLGDKDRDYIKSVIAAQRQLAALGRVVLLNSRSRPAWVVGTAFLGVAKILENMEIGHNVMHGQWDWMNDPSIHSSVWDWDTASTAAGWKHSHNYIHHTFTNIRGKDKDLGYEIMRIDPNQDWHPVYLFQPIYNILLMAFFEWGVALHDLDLDSLWKGEKTHVQTLKEMRGILYKMRRQAVKDYLGWPAISAGAFLLTNAVTVGRVRQPKRSRIGNVLRKINNKTADTVAGAADTALSGAESTFVSTFWANFTANLIRNFWSNWIIFCGHFPDAAYTFSEDEVQDETRGGWYARQLIGAANIDGSPLFHIASGNLSYQVEHHLYPDMPSSRYSQIAPKVKEICERYDLPYNTGPFFQQWGQVQRTILRLAFPGGKARPKQGPYHRPAHSGRDLRDSEAARFRGRLPENHPDAGPEQSSDGVKVSVPPRD